MLPLFVSAFLIIVLAFTNLAHAQDPSGFISIDCGLPANTSYPHFKTGLTYTSDASFVDTGVSKPVSPAIRTNNLDQELWYLRSFPDNDRNCYHIDVTQGTRYLVRGMFLYGNYDGLNQYPTFNLHLGPNRWGSVRIVNISNAVTKEIIYVSPFNYIDICLVKTGLTTPFISALELRPLMKDAYVIESGFPVGLFTRLDLGSSTDQIVRYPDDVFDRRWYPVHINLCTDINTTETIDRQIHNVFQLPLVVMSSANVPTNASLPLEFSLDTLNGSLEFYVYMHFAEIEKLQTNESRQFNITLNGTDYYGPLKPTYLYTSSVYSLSAATQEKYDFSMFKVGGSTRPPLLNALEVFYVVKFPQLQTEERDIDAIAKIKIAYKIRRNWQGDPCAPQVYSWQGLSCSYDNPESDPPRIVTLNLSSSGLTGVLAPGIADLKLLTSLDLSNNNLTGAIPEFLSHLPSLKLLNLTRNNLTGTVPLSLYEKHRSGSLNLSVDGNPNLCTPPSCGQGKEEGKKKKSIVVPVVASAGGVLLLLVIIAVVSTKLSISKRRNPEVTTDIRSSTGSSHEQEPLEGKRRQFSYFDVLKMTNNLGTVLGKGGFGTVYHGILDGQQVAVKLLDPSSTQGYKEFKAEVNVLLRVHHKNLMALLGYCDEGTHMGLIYEYMANGNLKFHLSDGMLSWESRLRIALEAAQGLEYLHNGCKPPIVHRDVKSTNILLNENFQAKLADFGLSRAFLVESGNHVSTSVAGTPGYLDPECLETRWSTEKNDVYSFGVVLLEIAAGRLVIVKSQTPKTSHIIEWARSKIHNGDIKNVIDARLQGDYEINSLWKVVEIAMECVDVDSATRPRMNQVVTGLSECLAMEMTRTRGRKSAPSPLVTVNLNHTGLSPLLR